MTYQGHADPSRGAFRIYSEWGIRHLRDGCLTDS
jgi:hypothetical protein